MAGQAGAGGREGEQGVALPLCRHLCQSACCCRCAAGCCCVVGAATKANIPPLAHLDAPEPTPAVV